MLHNDPNQRPSFSSICRILRFIKRFIAMNPDYSNQIDAPVLLVDYSDVDLVLLRKFPLISCDPSPISQIPFQMFAYQVIEKEEISLSYKENSDTGSDVSACGDEFFTSGDEPSPITERKLSVRSDRLSSKPSLSRKLDLSGVKQPVTTNRPKNSPPQMSLRSQSQECSSTGHMMTTGSSFRRTSPGHVSDSELS